MATVKPTGKPEPESELTVADIAEVRTRLEADVARLRRELAATQDGLTSQIRDSIEATGEIVDVGTLASDVGTETSLANNSQDILAQSERALERIANSRYGTCESCGSAIDKARLQAFPRATLCLHCQSSTKHR